MLTLETIAGVQARIHRLPGRPPFMLANDAAEIYGTSAKRVAEAVKRNPDNFPKDFAFRLTREEMEAVSSQRHDLREMWRKKNYDWTPLAFTHGGAYGLAAVLRTKVAAQVVRAFANMEMRKLAEAEAALLLLQSEARGRRSLRSHIVDAQREGWSFEQLWRERGCARIKLAAEIRKCVWLKLIPEALTGTPADGGQFSMFGEA